MPTSPTSAVVTAFTSWRTNLANAAIQADGLGQQVAGTWGGTSFSSIGAPVAAAESAVFGFDASGSLSVLSLTSTTSTSTTTENFTGSQIGSFTDPDFVLVKNSTSQGVISNPKSLAWDYQSFGIWETGLGTPSRTLNAMSVGAPTAGANIPTTNTASFTGKVVGSYVDAVGVGHSALANLNVTADFANRTLAFSTTGTQTATNLTNFTPNSGLDLTGNLSYQAGTNSFTGPVNSATLSGTTTGRFYGPNAQELGGVFSLQASSGLETYSGAYGGKR
ncbi:MAG: transferrin-binding protein-like solute binding protein [Hyphomicrobiaceae bacterium]